MNIRVVAYRKRQGFNNKKEAYELDLQEAPNISLNYQFADVKDPSKRKASYSQTFKLPFTNNNNDFFQNWFDVNLETLVYSSSKKFPAVILAGSLVQFEGVIQLKAVYLKAKLYEVIILSNSADLFTNIGNKKLKDIFLNEDDISYSTELNHLYTRDNIEASWTGNEDGFLNSSSVSLRDTVADVQKVMYPLSITEPNFIYDQAETHFLNMDQTAIDSFESINDAIEKKTNIEQFRPAIQLRTLITKLIARAGFSLTSTFIDSQYFRKLYMTTCNHLTTPGPEVVNQLGGLDGVMVVGNSEMMSDFISPPGVPLSCLSNAAPFSWVDFAADTTTPVAGFTTPFDSAGIYENFGVPMTGYTIPLFKNVSMFLTPLKLRFWLRITNIAPCPGPGIFFSYRKMRYSNLDPVLGTTIPWQYTGEFEVVQIPYINEGTVAAGSGGNFATPIEVDIPWDGIAVGEAMRIMFRLDGFKKADDDATTRISFGAFQCPPLAFTCDASNYLYAGMYNEASVGWSGYSASAKYNGIVDIPACIDPSITQRDFLQDLIQRFNLVVLSNPDDPSNIIIEPYNDYLSQGSIKHWSNKIDLSKEITVKDTVSLQKQFIKLGDKEDKDLNNKRIAETTPIHNVYGKVEIANSVNEFAKGELTNKPIFSPYINDKVWSSISNTSLPTQIGNMTVQYEIGYTQNSEGLVEQKLEATNAKLFYYSGTPSILPEGVTDYHLHLETIDLENITSLTAFTFTSHPLCSPFELDIDAQGNATINANTKSLYWNANPPLQGNLSCFNLNNNNTVIERSLYYEYYSQYLNAVYDQNARILECHINLDTVDIFNFRFNDEIFIKDSYYRVLEIKNYVVGAKQSSKVVLLKIDDIYAVTCPGCDFTLQSSLEVNSLLTIYTWCANTNSNCTPSIDFTGDFSGLLTSQACCDCNNGEWYPAGVQSQGLGFCVANSNSPSVQRATLTNLIPIFSASIAKNLSSAIIGGKNGSFVIGNNTSRFYPNILPITSNDYVIKYKNIEHKSPQIRGESHKLILIGETTGNTRGYATLNGDRSSGPISMPSNSTITIRLKGTTTVIGGTSSTYGLGYTESFAYITTFVNREKVVSQVGNAGGVLEVSMRQDNTLSPQCSMYISNNGAEIQFGLDDAQTDTARVWQITADIDINSVPNIYISHTATYATFQNAAFIEFENDTEEYLIWN
mgnify:CR=1 FL=1|tara:strand:+ start:6111 stop:9686 length:3576 start_codon:yes stop_codon:yes gene_type:complete